MITLRSLPEIPAMTSVEFRLRAGDGIIPATPRNCKEAENIEFNPAVPARSSFITAGFRKRLCLGFVTASSRINFFKPTGAIEFR